MHSITLKRSMRAKYMRLSVRPGGAVRITAPHSFSSTAIEQFLSRHRLWIERAVSKMANKKALPVFGKRAYLQYRERARSFIFERVRFWNQAYGFTYNRIAIKNTKSLWGSCSRRGNLNFSYALLFLPRELADYIIVHELCHLKEHNHSRAFWALVKTTQSDYVKLRRELRAYMLTSR